MDVEAVRDLLNERWAWGGPWEIKRMHKDGLLAVGTCVEAVKPTAEARVLMCRGSILRVQPWALDRGTYPILERTTLGVKSARLRILLCDEARPGFLVRVFGRVKASTLRLVLEGRVNCVEVLVEVASPEAVPPFILFLVCEADFVVRVSVWPTA